MAVEDLERSVSFLFVLRIDLRYPAIRGIDELVSRRVPKIGLELRQGEGRPLIMKRPVPAARPPSKVAVRMAVRKPIADRKRLKQGFSLDHDRGDLVQRVSDLSLAAGRGRREQVERDVQFRGGPAHSLGPGTGGVQKRDSVRLLSSERRRGHR